MNALILDDEKLSGENLRVLIQKYCSEIESVSVIDNIEVALDKLVHTKYDILFLDIHLTQETGFKLLELIPKREFQTIMVSADESYGIQAIKEGVIDYLLKPVDIVELKKAVGKVKEKISEKSSTAIDKLSVPTQNGSKILDPEEIIRIEAQSNYSKIFCEDGSNLLVSKPLKLMEEKLLFSGFFRVHKSHLVKLSAIDSYSRNNFEIKLRDGTVLPLSRRNMSDFVESIKNMAKRV